MKRWASQKSGFTIVELLIVVVVIAILAAITIVAYNGIQNRAKQSALQENVKQAATKLSTYAVTASDTYPDPSAFTSSTGLTSDTNVTYTYLPSTDRKDYCVSATNVQNSALSYAVTSRSGSPMNGQCVTNYVPNASFEAGISGWVLNGAASSVQSSDWASLGSNSIRIIPSIATADTFIKIGGQGGMLGLTAGETYTVSATSRLSAAQTGTLDNRGRSIVVYSWTGTTSGSLGSSTPMSNSAGSLFQSTTFTIPSTVTGVEIRLYNGATNSANNSIYWDGVTITKGSSAVQSGDGSSSGWFWDGTPNASTSIGPALAQ